MSEEIKKRTVEEEFIEKGKEFFSDKELVDLSDIEEAIYETSSAVIRLFKTWWIEEVLSQKWDLSDHINQDLKNNKTQVNGKTFDDLVDEFIDAKIKKLTEETVWKNENVLEDREEVTSKIDELINKIVNNTQIIKEFIITLEEQKEAIEWMWQAISWQTLKAAKIVLETVKPTFLRDKKETEKLIEDITTASITIQTDKDELWITQNHLDLIINSDWEYISDQEIEKVNNLIREIEKSINTYEKQITDEENKNLARTILKSQKNANANWKEIPPTESNEEIEIIWKILSLFENHNKSRVTTTINHLFRWIDTIINSRISLTWKKDALRNPMAAINPQFLNYNRDALSLLKDLAENRIKKSLEEIENNYNISFTIPKQYYNKIISILKEFVWKNMENVTNNVKQNLRIKCKKFLFELNKYSSNLEVPIADVLSKIQIPENLHDDFKEIVNIYFKNKKDPQKVIPDFNEIIDRHLIIVKSNFINTCTSFFEELDRVVPYLLRSIEENQDIENFKTQYINPILIKLKIPQNDYHYFMEIVDIYHNEKLENLHKQALANIRDTNEIVSIHNNLVNEIDLIDQDKELVRFMSKKDIFELKKACKICLKVIKTNFPWRVAVDISIEEDIKQTESEKNENLAHTIHKRYLNPEKSSKLDDVSQSVKAITKEIKLKRWNRTIHPKKEENLDLSEILFQETVDYIFKLYPNIKWKIKEKFLSYMRAYYNSIKNHILENLNLPWSE